MNSSIPPFRVAQLPDSTRVPVVDVTHPTFHVDVTPVVLSGYRKQIAALPAATRPQASATAPDALPDLLRRMIAPSTPFLDGLATYLLKLGPAALPDRFGGEIERRLISTPNAMSLRVRLQQLATLMADALRQIAPDRPIRLLSIGGGTGIEAMNAMILLAKDDPGRSRRFRLDLLDVGDEGLALARSALSELLAPNGPLAGTKGSLVHTCYSWNEPGSLEALLQFGGKEYIIASSEGGLFEYASDETIVANLQALRSLGDIPIAGSVLRDDKAGRAMVARSPFNLQALGLSGVDRLAKRAGYSIAGANEGIASDQFLLKV